MKERQGRTWWSGRFLRSLERLNLGSRLKRGKRCFQAGGVSELQYEPGGLRAQVTAEGTYRCQIYFEPFTEMEWAESLERLAFQDLSAAALLTTGRMPPHIEDFFKPSSRRLLPYHQHEMEFHCSCPDRVDLCKHVAAMAYQFAEHLDRDPWLLLLMRGRTEEQIQTTLIDLWSRDMAEGLAVPEQLELPLQEQALSLDIDYDTFWGASIPEPPNPKQSLTTPGLILKRLANPEPKVDADSWDALLSEIYASVSQAADEQRMH